MCWYPTRHFRQPKRFLTYRAVGKLNDANEYNQNQELPRIPTLECHIFGLLKRGFEKQFEKLCAIVNIAATNFTFLRNENGAKVIQFKNVYDRNNLLNAFNNYERRVRANTGKKKLLPLTQKLLGGSSKRKISIRPGPIEIIKSVKNMSNRNSNTLKLLISAESWATVLNRRNSLSMGASEHRDYGNLINTSKILCHVF